MGGGPFFSCFRFFLVASPALVPPLVRADRQSVAAASLPLSPLSLSLLLASARACLSRPTIPFVPSRGGSLPLPLSPLAGRRSTRSLALLPPLLPNFGAKKWTGDAENLGSRPRPESSERVLAASRPRPLSDRPPIFVIWREKQQQRRPSTPAETHRKQGRKIRQNFHNKMEISFFHWPYFVRKRRRVFDSLRRILRFASTASEYGSRLIFLGTATSQRGPSSRPDPINTAPAAQTPPSAR